MPIGRQVLRIRRAPRLGYLLPACGSSRRRSSSKLPPCRHRGGEGAQQGRRMASVATRAKCAAPAFLNLAA